ncbi:putative galacturonosyltransferase-like 6 [Nymphaea thermarum]|nr:putative galacturonosyltransferase-like 6 [Nymphaea thermarum]
MISSKVSRTVDQLLSYACIYLSNLLFHSITYVIYLVSDLIVDDDINKLYSISFSFVIGALEYCHAKFNKLDYIIRNTRKDTIPKQKPNTNIKHNNSVDILFVSCVIYLDSDFILVDDISMLYSISLSLRVLSCQLHQVFYPSLIVQPYYLVKFCQSADTLLLQHRRHGHRHRGRTCLGSYPTAQVPDAHSDLKLEGDDLSMPPMDANDHHASVEVVRHLMAG